MSTEPKHPDSGSETLMPQTELKPMRQVMISRELYEIREKHLLRVCDYWKRKFWDAVAHTREQQHEDNR